MSLDKVMKKVQRSKRANEIAAKLLAEVASGEDLEIALPRVLEEALAVEFSLGVYEGKKQALMILEEGRRLTV